MDKPYLTSVNFDSVQIPEVKDWDVGEEYTIVLKVKMTNKSQYQEGEKNQKTNAGFEVEAYKALDDDYSDADLEELQGKGLSS